MKSSELKKVAEESNKYQGSILFGCSAGDWTNRVSLTLDFIPGGEEDLTISAHTEAFFDLHNRKYHSGQAKLITLEVNLKPELKQKLIAGGHISE